MWLRDRGMQPVEEPAAPIPELAAESAAAAPKPHSAASQATTQPSALEDALVPTTPTPTAPAPSPHAESLPLPPADTPLADILDALTRRADAGEPAAACRLAAELVRCGHREDLVSRMAMDAVRDAYEPGRHASIAQHPLQVQLAEANRICANVPATRINEAFRRTMDAADLGHAGARSWLAMHGETELPRHLFDAPELVQRWQRDVRRWAIASLDAGDRRVGGLWASVAGSPMDTPISSTVDADPTLRLALLRYRVLRQQRDGEPSDRLSETLASELAAGLSAESIALAESTAQRWVAAMGPRQEPESRLGYAERLMNRCNGM